MCLYEFLSRIHAPTTRRRYAWWHFLGGDRAFRDVTLEGRLEVIRMVDSTLPPLEIGSFAWEELHLHRWLTIDGVNGYFYGAGGLV